MSKVESNLEIERKFLVDEADLSAAENAKLYSIESVYLDVDKMAEIDPDFQGSDLREIRVTKEVDNTGLTKYWSVSKIGGHQLIREEAQITISAEEFSKATSGFGIKRLLKNRFKFTYNGNLFELDVFPSKNIIVMEIELKSPTQLFELPPFVKITRDVTGDKQFYGFNFAEPIS